MGDKMTGKKTLVPRLRFPEFQNAGEWKIKALRDLATRTTKKNHDALQTRVLTNSAEFGVVDQRDFFEKDIANKDNLAGYYIVEKGDYVYNPRISATAPVGPISKNGLGTGVMSPLYTVFRFTKDNNEFYSYYFKTAKWHAYMRRASSTGARHDRMSITTDAFLQLPIPVVSSHEKQKIAECLSSLDELISSECKKLDSLKAHKKGLMQQLFPLEEETTPLLRFPEFHNTDLWKYKPLQDIATRVTKKNHGTRLIRVLTNSAEFGVVDQRDFFEKDIANKDSFAGYYIVEKGDYVYNPRISTTAPVGPISKNGLGTGIMSPLYTVFRFTKEHNAFYLYFFKTAKWHAYMRQASSTGARHDRISITTDAFMRLPIPVASSQEQQKIADCLSSLDELITAKGRKIALLKLQKKGLLQQLFPEMDEVTA